MAGETVTKDKNSRQQETLKPAAAKPAQGKSTPAPASSARPAQSQPASTEKKVIVKKILDDSATHFEIEDTYVLGETIRQLQQEKHVLESEVRNLRDRLAKVTIALKTERQEWNSRLEQASTRGENFVEKYNELYNYSQQLIGEAEKHRKTLEAELLNAKKQLSEREHFFENELDHAKKQLGEKSNYDDLLTEIQVRETELMKSMHGLRNQIDSLTSQLNQSKKEEARSKFETSKVDAKLKIVLEGHLSAQLQLSKARDMLLSSIRILVGLQRSAKELLTKNTSGAQSTSLLSSKAASILIEQWNVEIENLRKLDILLSQINELHKTSQIEN